MTSFDNNGKYIKTNWKNGDRITADKLNKIEESIEAVNDNDISRHVEADYRLDALETDLASIENTKVNYFITPEMFGAVGDGVTDDTQALQDMINFAKNNKHSVMKSQKWRTYLITEGLSLGAYQKFDFSGATIKAGCSMDYVIKVDTSNKNWGCMENLSIDCDGLAKQGILTEWTSTYRFKGVKITNPVEYGIYAKKGNSIYNHILIENLI